MIDIAMIDIAMIDIVVMYEHSWGVFPFWHVFVTGWQEMDVHNGDLELLCSETALGLLIYHFTPFHTNSFTN